MSTNKWRGESPIFTKTYDLLLWLSGRVSQFPKAHRFRLARRIEDAAYSFHERLLLAAQGAGQGDVPPARLAAGSTIVRQKAPVPSAGDAQASSFAPLEMGRQGDRQVQLVGGHGDQPQPAAGRDGGHVLLKAVVKGIAGQLTGQNLVVYVEGEVKRAYGIAQQVQLAHCRKIG